MLFHTSTSQHANGLPKMRSAVLLFRIKVSFVQPASNPQNSVRPSFSSAGCCRVADRLLHELVRHMATTNQTAQRQTAFDAMHFMSGASTQSILYWSMCAHSLTTVGLWLCNTTLVKSGLLCSPALHRHHRRLCPNYFTAIFTASAHRRTRLTAPHRVPWLAAMRCERTNGRSAKKKLDFFQPSIGIDSLHFFWRSLTCGRQM